ncbi:MAG: type II toxin-antitoxin system prevent-host-death family antitoxin [Thermoflexales bacterium]|nr:type II toxin-antitoxin system prevent-host-death family antitoxin [Thermoflexales bacterium]
MPTVISATEAKNRFGEVIRRVYRDGETFIVERDGLPVVMIVPVRETAMASLRRFARAVRAAAQEAETLGITEEGVEQSVEEIREELHRERWGG